MKLDIVSTGKSVFVDWEQLDRLFNRWGKVYFGEHVTCTADREETDCNVAITDMEPGDFVKFKQLYARYDKEKEFEPEDDFGDGDSYITLPALISLGVIGEALGDVGLSKVGGCLAFYNGVLLVENDISSGEKIPLKFDSIRAKEIEESVEKEYSFVSSKSVPDSDGFMTDYSWYKSSNGTHVFVFGDNDIYSPEDGYFDHVCDDEREAEEWFGSYKGFEDELDAFSLDCMIKSAEAEKVEEENADVEMTYAEMTNFFHEVEKKSKMHEHVEGYIVFDQSSFDKEYSELSRTYVVSSDNKAFQPGVIGYSIYGSCLDGTDQCLRMDNWIRGFDCKRWDIERCYMKRDEYNKGCKIIDGKAFEDRGEGL